MKRYKTQVELQTREMTENKDPVIFGYFALFDVETRLFGNYCEKVQFGAFANSLLKNDVRCLFNHDTSQILGRLGNNTLTLREDEKGLYGELIINRNDTNAMNIYHQVLRGDITGCSFGFNVIDSDLITRDNDYIEVLKDVNLVEVSICTFPQYDETEIKARSNKVDELEKREKLKRRLEKYE